MKENGAIEIRNSGEQKAWVFSKYSLLRMQEKEQKKYSKFLSLVLRHKPELIGLNFDKNGWADTNDLLDKIGNSGFILSIEDLKKPFDNKDKVRFSLSDNLSKIRANQGHSLTVDVELTAKVPTPILYHGKAEKKLLAIQTLGLIWGQRHHVHLSGNREMHTH